ncbi:MAG: restriction endonuclease subunit S [Deltaproteobacteria bacterium]|jgi:type I restriction enzyme, S subunit|nr:restriction endonuclease subunit S [Deltaproteobacteria bacterium]
MRDRNENRPGYKKTKAGWIPAEWNCIPLEEVACVQTGLAKNNKRNQKNPIELPYLRVANVQDNFLDLREIKTIEVEKSVVERSLLKYGDVLLTEGGDFDKLGRGTIWKNEIAPCLHQNHIFAVRCKKDELNSYFLAALSSSNFGRRYFILSSKQSTNLASINSTQLKKFSLPLPKLTEQQKITTILSTWDTAISQTRKLIDVKTRRKKALTHQLLFGKVRLVGFQDSWKDFFLGDLFFERKETNGDHLPLLAITGKRGIILASGIDRKDSSNTDKSKYKRIAPGDIGYNTMRMWQGVSAVSDLEGIVSPAYTICRPKETVNVLFMGYLFKFPSVIHSFWRHSQGLVSDTWNLKFHHFAQIKVKIPNVEEQKAIARFLTAVDDEIKSYENKLAALEKQKRGLMQKLLTGEVRVNT